MSKYKSKIKGFKFEKIEYPDKTLEELEEIVRNNNKRHIENVEENEQEKEQ